MTEEIQNALDQFSKNIFQCLIGERRDLKGLLVKKHTENLLTHGDFSFPISLRSWHGFAVCDSVGDKKNTTLLEVINKKPEFIIEESKKWNLPVYKVKEEHCRLFLFLERTPAIRVGLSEASRNNVVLLQRLQKKCCTVCLDPLCVDGNDNTSLRVKYVKNVIENICKIHKLDLPVFVTCKSTSKKEACSLILCGTVLNSITCQKETEFSAEDFIRQRQDEMTLIAQHKYGVRVSTDSKWKAFIAYLGESAAAFELLQAKPSGPVKINFSNCAVGSSKGASFILYNCARLETIIRTFNDSVSEGKYPKLPPFEDADFSLLTHEDEWCLIFNYILGLPTLLEMCIQIKDDTYDFKPHLICNFLSAMVRVFSQYYRKVRILMEPRTHLLPVIYARIHMLTVLNEILKTCLYILNIKSVSQM